MNEKNRLTEMKIISVIGASGFIGKHFVALLSARINVEIRVLVHHKKLCEEDNKNIVFIEGNLLKPKSLIPLLEPGCTVINLAYLANRSRSENIDAMTNLACACAELKVKRLIHCSTAVVAGKSSEDVIDETTPCLPTSEYQRSKLAIEAVLLERALGRFEISILRPSAVFGPDGQNLIKLANELTSGKKLKSYAKSCLFGHRSMNLVCVENVVAALAFLLDAGSNINREVFIISDDDAPINNYAAIEKRLMKNLGIKPFAFPMIPFPMMLLEMFLRLARKSQSNPVVKYSDQKLARLGFAKPLKLEAGIDSFSSWYKSK
jgi:nucleoside-diphosphate-sugar epimerase